MITLNEAKAMVDKKLEILHRQAKNYWGVEAKVSIHYDVKSIRTIAYFRHSDCSIHLNPELLKEYGVRYVNNTLVHEYAHYIQYLRYGNSVRPHGKEFKNICRVFGIEGKASTNIYVESKFLREKLSKNRVEYKCNCQSHWMTKRQDRKIRLGIASYTCNSCKSKLAPANTLSV